MAVRKALGRLEDFDCRQAQERMSAFLDSMTSDEESGLLRAHVACCLPCQRQLQGYVSLRRFIASVQMPDVPKALDLETRIRLSHARTTDFIGELGLRIENMLKPHTVPVVAGVLATVMCFGFLLGSFGASMGRLGPGDAALFLYTQPRARGPLISQLAELGDLTVDVNIDQKGKVYAGVILNGPQDPELHQWLRDVLLLGTFDPAMVYGHPVPSRLILSFVGVKS